jgi:hypothetical protein
LKACAQLSLNLFGPFQIDLGLIANRYRTAGTFMAGAVAIAGASPTGKLGTPKL